MKSNIIKSLIGGLAGTAVMTIVTMMAPYMGLPKMSPPEMLSGMMGFPIIVGWIMHFMIGISFAAVYVLILQKAFISLNTLLRGALFGIAAFVFAQVMMLLMGMVIGGMPSPESPMLMMIGSFMGHIIFGVVVAKTVEAFSKN